MELVNFEQLHIIGELCQKVKPLFELYLYLGFTGDNVIVRFEPSYVFHNPLH